MNENTRLNESKFQSVSALLERIRSFFEEASLRAETQNDYEPMFKFRTLLLIAEVYEFVRVYFANRTDHLSDYFSEINLKISLQFVIDIEDLQSRLFTLYENLCGIDESLYLRLSEEFYAGKDENDIHANEEYKILYNEGIDRLNEYFASEGCPTIGKSLIWKEEKSSTSIQRFNKVFHRAKEILDEPKHTHEFSIDKDDQPYNHAKREQQLGNHVVSGMKNVSFYDESRESDFDFLDFVLDTQNKANYATAKDLYKEFSKSLEMLRNAFMTEAEDIYYIRTGNFAKLKNVLSEKEINYFYTELPFREYKEERYKFERFFIEEDLVEIQEEWRYNKGCVSRRMTESENIEFLKEEQTLALEEMQRYEELWKLRVHSGGLDTDVTPDNFARMFYRRQDANNFIMQQWKYEILTDLIAKYEKQTVMNEAKIILSPEEKAVTDFIDNVIQLANTLNAKWDGKVVVPGVHQPAVKVAIKNLELIAFLQNQQKNNFDELMALCFPPTSNSKKMFCTYINQIKKQYFENLPNKDIAEDLAPIVSLAVGTVTNYLSQS